MDVMYLGEKGLELIVLNKRDMVQFFNSLLQKPYVRHYFQQNITCQSHSKIFLFWCEIYIEALKRVLNTYLI